MRIIIYTLITILLSLNLNAQDGVGINTDTPDPSAILDISSTTQGVLVPRMNSTERDGISSPATGLLIYNSTTNTFWFYDGTSWIEISSSVSTAEIIDADGDTKVEVEKTTDDDLIRFTMANTEYFQMTEGRLNVMNTGNSVFLGNLAGRVDDLTDNNNVFVGASSGQFNTIGNENVGIGYRALRNNTSGTNNVAIGEEALKANQKGKFNISIGGNSLNQSIVNDSNVAIGYNSISSLISGNNNVGIGTSSMFNKTSGNNNVAIGSLALNNNLVGNSNTAIGRQSGSNSTGSGNVFLGFQSGQNETGDDKLYVDNSNTSKPLIWGDFKEDSVVVNGDLFVTNNITYVGTLTDVSDKRLKENIDTLENVMYLINQLQAYSYKMKSSKTNEREFGLIAQEVQKVFPEMVKIVDKENGFIGVNYLQLIAILIEGLKEQQIFISEMEKNQVNSKLRLNLLNAEINKIKAELDNN